METKLWHGFKEKPKNASEILVTDEERIARLWFVESDYVKDTRDRDSSWEFESKYWKRWCYAEDILRIK